MPDDGRFTCEGGAPWELEYAFVEQQSRGDARYDTRELGPFPEPEVRDCPPDCTLCWLVRGLLRRRRRRGD
jgi:hypothetical protein